MTKRATQRAPQPAAGPGSSYGSRGKDLRIPNTTPEELAKVLMSGGAKPRPETRRRS